MTAAPPEHEHSAGVHQGETTGRFSSPSKASRTAVGSVVAVCLALVLGAAVALIPLPFVVFAPGPVVDVLGADTGPEGESLPRIVVDGPTYPTSGSLDFTSVRLSGGPVTTVDLVDVLHAWIDPAADVYPVDDVFRPGETSEQVAEEDDALMRDSQQAATAVALRAAGFSVGQRIVVVDVDDSAPAGAEIRPGDVLVSVAGVPATDPDAVRAALAPVPAGDPVDVVVERDGQQLEVRPVTSDREGTTVLGVVLRVDAELPFPVTIDAGEVGGPSAGLIFALGTYDLVTEGALTGGQHIAGTGTISSSGAVGPIGGIAQKMVGARQSGAAYFLAPVDNCPSVVGREPDGLTVVAVGSFDEALAALRTISSGGDAATLPHC